LSVDVTTREDGRIFSHEGIEAKRCRVMVPGMEAVGVMSEANIRMWRWLLMMLVSFVLAVAVSR